MLFGLLSLKHPYYCLNLKDDNANRIGSVRLEKKAYGKNRAKRESKKERD